MGTPEVVLIICVVLGFGAAVHSLCRLLGGKPEYNPVDESRWLG